MGHHHRIKFLHGGRNLHSKGTGNLLLEPGLGTTYVKDEPYEELNQRSQFHGTVGSGLMGKLKSLTRGGEISISQMNPMGGRNNGIGLGIGRKSKNISF